MSATKKPKASKLFPDELIDQLLAQVQNKDAESILEEFELAGQFKKQLAERMLTTELTRHLDTEAKQGRTGNPGTRLVREDIRRAIDVLKLHVEEARPIAKNQ